MKAIKILFIDPAQLFRKGFALYLDAMDSLEVVNDCSTINDLKEAQLKDIDLILFDTVSDHDYAVLSKIKKEYPELSMLLLSALDRLFENYLFASTHNIGAFLSKEVIPERVVETIERLVFKNETGIVFPENIRERLFGETHLRNSFFSNKELDVLGLLGKGKSTQEAAEILNNSKRTVETHRRRMIERIGCKNIIPVILYALNNNYLQIDAGEY